jgi:hypothetical protein
MTIDPNTPGEPTSPGLNGHEMVDVHMDAVGTVTDVLFDDMSFTPKWAIVRTGFFWGERYVPLEHAYVDESGRLVVAFDKAAIKRAPRARGQHVISPDTARELREYYNVAA